MMRGILMMVLWLGMLQNAFAQPPLSKRLQKEKAEFEALIAREAKYDSLVTAADQAFIQKDYLLARMTYEDAIPYNDEKAQWLQSKVNDLDILMAKNAAREVDSIMVSLSPKQVQQLRSEDKPLVIQGRSLEAPLPLPERELAQDTIEENAAEQQPLAWKEEPVPTEEPVKPPTPAVKEPVKQAAVSSTPRPKVEKVKVKEDFSSYDNGITEETFNLQNHTVLRIVVKEGIDVMVFKKVKHNWGGEFYFLDDVATTKRYWDDQVAAYRDKYGTEGN